MSAETTLGPVRGEMLHSVDIPAMVERRNAARAALLAHWQRGDDLQALLSSVAPEVPSDSTVRMPGRGIHIETAPRKSDRELALQEVDAYAWSALMHFSGLLTFMDKKAREEWQASIRPAHVRRNSDAKGVPEFTEDMIAGTFESIHANRGRYFLDGLVRLYQSLSFDYKTNSPRMIGKRLILDYMLSESWSGGLPTSLEYRTRDRLDDLQRVFLLLDGKPEADHRESLAWEYDRHIRENPCNEWWASGDGMFKLRGFKKGTLHVEFLCPELVDLANQMIAKEYPNAIPA